jgi:hypothetical protein
VLAFEQLISHLVEEPAHHLLLTVHIFEHLLTDSAILA